MSAAELRQAAAVLDADDAFADLDAIVPGLCDALAKSFSDLADVMGWVGCIERDGGLWDDMGSPKIEWDATLAVARLINGVGA